MCQTGSCKAGCCDKKRRGGGLGCDASVFKRCAGDGPEQILHPRCVPINQPAASPNNPAAGQCSSRVSLHTGGRIPGSAEV